MTEPQEKKGLSPRITAILVIALFVAPILIAWWMVYWQPPLVNTALLNRGTLITPPLNIHAESSLSPLSEIDLGPGEWALVYFTTSACGDVCRETLETIDKIFLVLGHDMTRVKKALVVGEKTSDLVADAIVNGVTAQRLAQATTLQGGEVPNGGLVFLDWRGRVMLYFEHGRDPADIKKDLKRLLRGSKTK